MFYVENDYSIGEYIIPAGSSILVSQYVMHHQDVTKNHNNLILTGVQQTSRLDYPDSVTLHLEGDKRLHWRILCMHRRCTCSCDYFTKMKMDLVPRQSIELDPAITPV